MSKHAFRAPPSWLLCLFALWNVATARAESAGPVGVVAAPALRQSYVAMTWSGSTPARALRRELAGQSFQGFEYSVHFPAWRGWYIGVAGNYNNFYQSDGRRTYHTPQADVTATYYRSVVVTSLSFVNRYYLFPDDAPIRLYGGARVGVAFFDAARWVADRGLLETPVGVLLTPEAGVVVRLGNWLDVTAGYQFMFSTASFWRVGQASFHAVQIGPQLRY